MGAWDRRCSSVFFRAEIWRTASGLDVAASAGGVEGEGRVEDGGASHSRRCISAGCVGSHAVRQSADAEKGSDGKKHREVVRAGRCSHPCLLAEEAWSTKLAAVLRLTSASPPRRSSIRHLLRPAPCHPSLATRAALTCAPLVSFRAVWCDCRCCLSVSALRRPPSRHAPSVSSPTARLHLARRNLSLCIPQPHCDCTRPRSVLRRASLPSS